MTVLGGFQQAFDRGVAGCFALFDKKKPIGCECCFFVLSLQHKKQKCNLMTFDRVIEDGRLWAVHFDNDKENALEKVMSQWSDAGWLAE